MYPMSSDIFDDIKTYVIDYAFASSLLVEDTVQKLLSSTIFKP